MSGPGTDEESVIEAWLTPEQHGTRLVVEERGIPLGAIPAYRSGWQVHLDDLGRSLHAGAEVHPEGWSADTPAASWQARWLELSRATAAGTDAPR